MGKKFTILSALLALLLGVGTPASAQKVSKGMFNELYPLHRRLKPDLDSSINVAKLSLVERNKLLTKLFEVDQMYRDSLNRVGWTSESIDAKRYSRLMAVNDPVNQILLLKILKLDGWPCDKAKGEKSLSYKAWFIVWHDRGSYEGLRRFYPYLEKANKLKCIEKNQFRAVSDLLKQTEKFRCDFAVPN